MIRTLHLAYTSPYDFAALLAFFAKRAIPGVETVDATSYRRVFALDGAVGSLEVTALPETPALQLRVDADGEHDLADIAARVRRMFDLDADPAAINAALSKRALLKRCPNDAAPANRRLPPGPARRHGSPYGRRLPEAPWSDRQGRR